MENINSVIINDICYKEGDKIKYKDGTYEIEYILKFGMWAQDGSSGEFNPTPCYGWFAEAQVINKINVSSMHPFYEKGEGVLGNYYVYKNSNVEPSTQQEEVLEYAAPFMQESLLVLLGYKNSEYHTVEFL